MITKNEFEQLLANSRETLSREEEKSVFEYYEAHKTADNRNKIIMKNQRLVWDLVRKGTFNENNAEDYFQEGIIGMIRAIDYYDYKLGNKFSTYATWWVRQAISRYRMNNDRTIRIPVHMVEKYLRVKKEIAMYIQTHGESTAINFKEIAKNVNLSEEETFEIYNNPIFVTVSLNKEVSTEEDDSSELGDFIQAPDSEFDDDVASRLDFAQLHEIMQKKLPKREYDILCMRFGMQGYNAMTLEEVGQVFGVTRERIRQLEAKALRKLRMSSTTNGIRSFKDYVRG